MVELAQRPMPTSRVTHASNELVIRLRRVEGQVRGIQRMVTEGAPCSEVLTQLAAAPRPPTPPGPALPDTRPPHSLARPHLTAPPHPAPASERLVRRDPNPPPHESPATRE